CAASTNGCNAVEPTATIFTCSEPALSDCAVESVLVPDEPQPANKKPMMPKDYHNFFIQILLS
ncbi:hypothetical protein P5D95_26885, partial [Vibrio parahaemolyticus]|nr:hypothetical protein [Vibrio parahaemolyticus]